MADNLDRFTKYARQVLQTAHEEATRLNHNYIGTEHVLLGLAKEESGLASKVLRGLGASPVNITREVERLAPRNPRAPFGRPTLTTRTKRVIELAIEGAKQMGHVNVGTEHLLLGLVSETEGIAAEVLRSLGIDLGKVRVKTNIAINPPELEPPDPVPHLQDGRGSELLHPGQRLRGRQAADTPGRDPGDLRQGQFRRAGLEQIGPHVLAPAAPLVGRRGSNRRPDRRTEQQRSLRIRQGLRTEVCPGMLRPGRPLRCGQATGAYDTH